MTKSRNRIEGEGGRVSLTQVTTSGTAHDFTGIPAWVTKIELLFDEVSLNNTDNILVQLGDAGGFETTGYESVASDVANAGSPNVVYATTSFFIKTTQDAHQFTGIMTIERLVDDPDQWVMTLIGQTTTPRVFWSIGRKTLSDVLTQLRVTAATGTFDNGSVTLFYE